MFQFASCDVARCEQFLRKAYPTRAFDMMHPSIADIMGLVRADVIRITDPDFHTPKIVASKGFTEAMRDDLYQKSKAMHDYIMTCERRALETAS